MTFETSIRHGTDPERRFRILRTVRENGSAGNNGFHNISISTKQYPVPLLRTLFGLMDLSSSVVNISNNLYGTEMIEVSTSRYMALHIESAINKAIETTMYPNLSVLRATEIIQILGLSQHVYCIEGHESGACLVVLEKNLYSDQKNPQEVFRRVVNGLRTSYQRSTESISDCIRRQLQIQALEDQQKQSQKIESDRAQALRLGNKY